MQEKRAYAFAFGQATGIIVFGISTYKTMALASCGRQCCFCCFVLFVFFLSHMSQLKKKNVFCSPLI